MHQKYKLLYVKRALCAYLMANVTLTQTDL